MADTKTLDLFTQRWPLLAAAAATFLGASLFQYLYKWNIISSIPLVGEEIGDAEKRRVAYIMGAKRLYEEGYKKVEWLLFNN